MGAKHYVVKLFGCLLVSLLCWTRVQGQVVITETVEVQPSGQTGFQMAEGNVVGPGGYYHPVLHRIGRGTYVVLKTGELKFYFEEAQSYGIEQIEEHVLDYSIVGPSTSISGSADVIDYLGNPILLQEGAEISCNQTQTYFVSELEYAIGPTDDTWILTSFEGTEYGNSNILDARSYNFTPPTHPDQTMSTSYLQFGIGQFNTNANLRDAYFLIAADTLVTNYESEYYIYKVAGPWNEETLSFENRPPTDVSNYLVVTSTDTIPSAGLIYSSDISSFVSGWLYGTFPDHGIRIASASRHVFESKENYFGTIPTIGLRLTLPEEEINPILNFGYVQAGDTLSVEYMGLSDNFRPTFADNPVHANDRLTFNKHTGCQTNTYMSLLPHIDEDSTRLSHFEFVLNNELNLPADGHAYKDIYIEPNILFDNGIVGLPGRMFFDYYAELHEVSTVSIPEGTPGLPAGMSPVALLDGSPNGWASFRPNKPGTTLQYLSNPLAQGKTFKLVVAGTIR
ncbi:MAG: DNRLRE domain-containing protein, partial [Balneolaceae bacterium]